MVELVDSQSPKKNLNKSPKKIQKTEDAETEVEFRGQKMTPADQKIMQRVLDYLERKDIAKEVITKFINEFQESKKTGILVIKELKRNRCYCCHTLGHDHVICPKTWAHSELNANSCYVCGKPGYPHPECKKIKICYVCKESGHVKQNCPSWKDSTVNQSKKRPAEEEAEAKADDNDENENDIEDEDENENSDMESPKKKTKVENTEDEPVKAPKKKKKKKNRKKKKTTTVTATPTATATAE